MNRSIEFLEKIYDTLNVGTMYIENCRLCKLISSECKCDLKKLLKKNDLSVPFIIFLYSKLGHQNAADPEIGSENIKNFGRYLSDFWIKII